YAAWFAIFHQRYSTNTAPSWERAQPFRFVAHNGEINTIRGNVAWMRSREGRLGAEDLAPEDLLAPIIDESGSDSAMFDEALELLVRGGRELDHAAAMLVPAAWEHVDGIAPEVRDFFRYHSALVEPWDGPAGLVFSDGLRVAASLDRNGLRPLRIQICEDGLVACSSEAGAVSTRGHGRITRDRLGPGQMLLLSPTEGGLLGDTEIKKRLARRRPYGDWVDASEIPAATGSPVTEAPSDVVARQVAAGYSKEEFTVVIRPMGSDGAEPTSSMGDDTAQPPLSGTSRGVFSYLKQRFAQVTNPPIDHLRERHVMSTSTYVGPRAALLHEKSDAARLRRYPSFILFPDAVEGLIDDGAVLLDATFDVLEGPDGLEPALRALAVAARSAVNSGAEIVVVSDRGASEERAAIPSALSAGAVHHALLDAGLRGQVGIVVETDDARETHHFACLLTNGADAVCPRLALESLCDLAVNGRLGGDAGPVEAQRRFARAVEDGVLKVMSKMGISTLDSYKGAQIIEAIGLGPDVIDLCFPGVSSPLGGLSLVELGADALIRHTSAAALKPKLVNSGFIKFKKGGEYHAFEPPVVDALHEHVGIEERSAGSENAGDDEMAAAHQLRAAVRGVPGAYDRFARLVNERPAAEPRDLLVFAAAAPVPLDEVEDASSIARRFSSGAMSHGALSAEAHETMARALNLIGGAANSGEGGEAPERFADDRNCAIKQVASGRFGATPAYIAGATELQIKMAQGSKPGEGGQLPGKKVSVEIARLRHTVPGVALISPPPHHDIYSIEDLAQLIFDLKQANPSAKVSVKLVASEGVGTIAAGVVKGLADVVHVSGGDGGTGASPLASIKNAGLPWEIGLAEVREALTGNDLRGRARVRVDGGFKTGRDVVVAALLGADEFSFGTAILIAEGCIMVRTCHRNTCPVGITTQDEKLRAKFTGTPEMVAEYLMSVADEARTILASLGLRSIDEAIGRVDLLEPRVMDDARAASLNVASLLTPPVGERAFTGSLPLQSPRSRLGDELFVAAVPALEAGEEITLDYKISTADRTVGARLGCWAASRWSPSRPPGGVGANFTGAAGQSFGAFLSDGIGLNLIGEANDYVAKGMGGGRVTIRPPENDAGNPVLAGNTVLYGATGGQLFIAGRAGERFAVRNSGAVAVVEGTGDHACEYMTGGAVVILGPTGRNLGAGMSGGEAYVYDPAGELERNLNDQLVAAYEPTEGQLTSLQRVVTRHLEA
ncbi:MAG: glutamate synthase large subunit, partial [Actinobacteria bacterium]|nr:glutamate synthase large subunit [Actinomycetota bacterium]